MAGSASDRCRVIYNPSARGEKARRFRAFLDRVEDHPDIRATTGAGSARALAREAVEEGVERVIAAGGDGTVFEVLNGMAEAEGGWARSALGVFPLGTANVLAHELGMPTGPEAAWQALRGARVTSMDGGWAEYRNDEGGVERAYFGIVAGAGLDARAVQQVRWESKRRWGKGAYILAALRAWIRFRDRVRCTMAGGPFEGRVVLAGNGCRYAGNIPVFEQGALDSGRLHVQGVDGVTAGVLLRCLRAYLTGHWDLGRHGVSDRVIELGLEAAGEGRVPLQLDGEFVGWLPARLRVLPGAIRVLMPVRE